MSIVLTLDDLMERAMSEIDDVLDTRDTSIIYQAVAMVMVELAYLYTELGAVEDEIYADTASRPSLLRIAKDRKIFPYDATKAKVEGVFNIDVPIGSRFNCDLKNFIVIEKRDGEHTYLLECEDTGAIEYIGDLIPIENIDGLEMAYISKIILNGEDEESTESLRKRYYNSFDYQAFGGNRAEYKELVGKMQDVGGVRVYRIKTAENRSPNIKVVIINSSFDGASVDLVTSVQNKLDPHRDGDGRGLIPIGHIAIVEGVREKVINISTHLTLDNDVVFDDVKANIESSIRDYFKEICYKFEDDDFERLIVRLSQIETRITNITGVIDIENTTINGENRNVTLELNEIPKLGGVVNA